MNMNRFTLIELLVVIAIIGILVTILLPSLTKARYKTKMAVCRANLSQCSKALAIYTKNSKGRFPDASPNNIGATQSGWIGNTKNGGVRGQLNEYLGDDDNYQVKGALCPDDEVDNTSDWAFKRLGSSYCGNIWSAGGTRGLNGIFYTEVIEPVKTWTLGGQAFNYFKQGVEGRLPEGLRFHRVLNRQKFPAVFVDGSGKVVTPRNGVLVADDFRHTWKN